MKKIYKSLKMCLLGAVFVSISTSVFGQDQTVTGRVTSDDTEALIGVTVVVRGTTNGTVTDVDGNYAISVPADGVLVFSYVGFKETVIPINGRSTVDVVLELDLEVLQEIVVVGYGEQNRRDVTGSIVSVKADELSQATPLGALEGMRGRLSGVAITENGAPGEAADIQIRGNTSLNATGGPLFVVDGQQLDNIDNLNPNDIASIEVLKDGASAAIYGSRSANGVIIVTTKKGKSGKTRIDASYVRSYTSLATKIPVSNTRQARQYELARSGNSNAQTADTPPDSLSQLFNQDFDYQEIITRVAVRDQVGLSLSGGNDNANFYWNGSYLNQEGVVNNSDFVRFNSTLNVNFKVGEKINAGTRFIASYSERNGLNEGAVFGQLATHFPYLPTRDADGTFVPQTSSQQNVEAETLLTVRERRDYDGQFFSFIEIDPLPNLKFTSRLGIIFELQRDNDFNPAIVQPRAEAPSGSENTELNYSLQQENFLTWSKKFGDHNITALAGVQIQKWKEEFSRFESVTFNNDLIRTFNNVEDLTLGDGNTGTTATSHSLASQFGRVSYDYKGKYLVSGTIRRDGSSRFGDDNQYGVFPAVSVGWRISDESFMQPLSRYIADLKFRASIAENGNERIGNFLSVSQYTPGAIYDGVNGTFQSNLGNQALAWESTTQFNYGVDLALLGGRLNVTFDAY
ncbi:MAG: SusC/RagA family TonB-linked outer membrane protein, partial [Bacteroidota bacterium]